MTVTATEFKANFGKYLELIATEDIFITRNGKTVAKVVNPQVTAVNSLRGMLGGISSGVDMDSYKVLKLCEEHKIDGFDISVFIPTEILMKIT